ncbi:MAG: S9 family peptidase [Myxococcales bacterium]|nr:S9 family peptidase [Myxococcales bacterium]
MLRRRTTLAAFALLCVACDPPPKQGGPPQRGADEELPPLPADHDAKAVTASAGEAADPTKGAATDEGKGDADAPAEVVDDRFLAVPDSVVVDGVPPIPKEIAHEVGAYAEARSASFTAWHPAADAMLVLTRFAETPQVHEVRAPGGARHQLTFFEDRVLGASFAPKSDGSFFVFAKDVGGDEYAQNWRFDRATGRATLLTDGESKNSLGVWAPDGGQMVYTSTRRSGKDNDFYIIDPRDPATDRLFAENDGGGWWPVDWSRDGAKILALDYKSVNEGALWTFDVATGERAQVTPPALTGPVAWGGGVFTADGKGVLSTSDWKSEYRHIVRVDVDSHEVTDVVPAVSWDMSSYVVTEDRSRLAVAVNENGFSKLHLYDLPSGRERPLKAEMPKGRIMSLGWHPGGQLLAFTLSSARSPSDAYVLDTKAQKVTRWTSSEVGGLDPSAFAEPEAITWKSFDEREIPGLYYRPPARFEGKRPLMILIHGGPESQARAGFITRLNYYLSELGIAIIYPNVRGSTGYGKSYTRLDNGLLREDSVKDIGALLDWVAEQPELDKDRVMIMGGSYGGYMTLASAVHYADRIRCAVDIVGISNFVSFLENTKPYRQDLRRAEYGDERLPEMRAFLESIAPLAHADKIQRPLFVIQGRNDPRVPASEAEQIVATMKGTGTPVWYLEAKDEGHGFKKKSNQDFQMYATVLFVKTFLLGD